RATVGRFVSIHCANSVIVAMITEVSCEHLPTSDIYIATAGVDLLGEIFGGPDRPKFQRGVTNYPTIGDAVDLITNQELRTVYAPSGSDQINVGALQQDPSVIAYVDVEEMLSKHFAVLGSTGVGKSTGVSLLLNGIYTQYQNSDRVGLKRADPKSVYTVDTPVPYRLVDLISLIDERMGKLENRSSRIIYHKLISRVETVRNDPRYAFMFDNANVG